ncbi:unnamed protein product [Orchesella dallaii]|uniref:Ribosomal protein S10 n=1 Tax=Orchesella dallaii TaxID=48710 RepID=A0ABP1PRW5_9HEXA
MKFLDPRFVIITTGYLSNLSLRLVKKSKTTRPVLASESECLVPDAEQKKTTWSLSKNSYLIRTYVFLLPWSCLPKSFKTFFDELVVAVKLERLSDYKQYQW